MTKSSLEQFDVLAKQYAQSEAHRFGPSLPVLLEFAAATHTDTALDIATGPGHTALTLAPLVAQVIGIDLSENMLAQAKERAAAENHTNAHFMVGNAEELPFADGTFTLLTSRHAPHHFSNVERFLSEAFRVLNRAGG